MNDTERGAGWLLFAGIMVFIAGTLNIIWGIAAISDAKVFVNGSHYVVFTNLHAWGWVTLIIGIIQMIAAFSIWAGNEFGRWIGIMGSTLSAIGSLGSINAYPFWGLCLFGLDILVIYGLVAYGGHASRRTA
jgi:hypothetical protein